MAQKSFAHTNIREVAKLAGVSTATVSRTIGGVGYVSTKSRKAVEEAIKELNYTPSQVARSLRQQRSPLIGLIVSDIKNPYYPELVGGIEEQVHQKGYSLILCNTQDNPEREIKYLDFLLSQRADGIIICSSGLVRRNIKKLNTLNTHIVLADVEIDLSSAKFPRVFSDSRNGGFLVGKHLAECGYTKIVYIGSDLERRDGSPRYEGLKAGCGEIPVHYYSGGESLNSSSEVMDEILERIKPPFAIFAHNDLSAIGVLSSLRNKGIEVPGEIGVVGYDNITISSFVSPRLTTVKHNHQLLGASAVTILESLISGKSSTAEIKIPLELIVRNSTTQKIGRKK